MGLPSPETATSHRWQTIGRLVTFQQAAKTGEGDREGRGRERVKGGGEHSGTKKAEGGEKSGRLFD